MPGVIPGPEHLSNNALSPPPFVPPAELAEVYPELVDSMQTALYMNFPKPERQLRMLDEAAQFMARLESHAQLISTVDPIYLEFSQVVNKMKQFTSVPPTSAMRKVLEMGDAMKKLRRRASTNAKQAAGQAMEHNRAEKEAAKEMARQVKKSRKKKVVTPEDVPTSDEEEEDTPADEDVNMEEAPSKKDRDSSPDVVIVEDPVDFDKGAHVVISGGKVIPRPGHEQNLNTIIQKTVEANNVSAAPSKGKKRKIERAEVIRFPYVHINRIDRKSNAYIQAMNIIAKTAPEEAAKVALLSEMSPPAKRRRGRHDFVDFEKGTHDTSQDKFSKLSPSRPGDAQQIVAHARNTLTTAAGVQVSDTALLRAEFDTRNRIVNVIARMAADLSIHEVLVVKHDEMINLMNERQLSALSQLPEQRPESNPCPFHNCSTTPHSVDNPHDSVDLSTLDIPTLLDSPIDLS
ncbi:hypothetical protein C8R47DRAFT_1223001 [Mycena vitilis]|nr:hypothetical protein C8R47DRAFT_1228004 [Mycena vitilis]KAJ6469132.1 hypothetical protein C8R47DRAFT_1223001 [Mycena vitilis]